MTIMLTFSSRPCLPSIKSIAPQPTSGSSREQALPGTLAASSIHFGAEPESTSSLPTLLNPSRWRMPKAYYRWLESKFLYIGSKQSMSELLKVTLADAIAEHKQFLTDSFNQKEMSLKDKNEFNEILDNIQEIHFDSSPTVKNRAWYKPAKIGKPTILFSLGNAWPLKGIFHYLPLIKSGAGFLVYEYPGYGYTIGKPDEESLYRSVEAASTFLTSQGVSPDQQVLYGISLGGAVAVEGAKRLKEKGTPPRAIVLESTMTSFKDVVAHLRETSSGLIRFFMPNPENVQSKLDSLSKIGDIGRPVFIAHGAQDELIPVEFAEQLWNALPDDIKSSGFIFKPNRAGHSISTGELEPFFHVIRPFLERIVD